MVARYASHHVVRDLRPFSQTRQVQLAHLSLPAHVVHQKVGVAFAPDESHPNSSRRRHEESPDSYGRVTNLCVVYERSTTITMVQRSYFEALLPMRYYC